MLDTLVEKYDPESAVRSTIIKIGSPWTRSRQENLLVPSQTSTLSSSHVDEETKKAFDLLDAISRSGSLPIATSELHVFVAVSHCFDNDVMGTIVQDNLNPIAKLERSTLLLAGTIHNVSRQKLIAEQQQLERLQNDFPKLFLEN